MASTFCTVTLRLCTALFVLGTCEKPSISAVIDLESLKGNGNYPSVMADLKELYLTKPVTAKNQYQPTIPKNIIQNIIRRLAS